MPYPTYIDSEGNTFSFQGTAGAVEDGVIPFTPDHLQGTTAIISCQGTTTSATPNQSTPLVPASATRVKVTICNRTQFSEVIDVGSASVQTGGGIPIGPGGTYEFEGPGALGPIWVVSPNPSTPVSWVEM